MTTVCNIWMICLELNWFVYDPTWMLHRSEFVWTQQIEVRLVAIKSGIFRVNLYPLSFFVNTPFKKMYKKILALKKVHYSTVKNDWSGRDMPLLFFNLVTFFLLLRFGQLHTPIHTYTLTYIHTSLHKPSFDSLPCNCTMTQWFVRLNEKKTFSKLVFRFITPFIT